MTGRRFDLFLFAASPEIAAAADAAGIDGLVVDWENQGKRGRQAGHDTQINHQTVRDLEEIRRATSSKVVCRINALGSWTADEVESAIAGGADELLLPMVRTADDVRRSLEIVDGRRPLGILIETTDAVRDAHAFDALGISRAYVGLNDLAIERRTENLFDALADGTVEAVRERVRAPFGFGGLTIPGGGRPIPCALLINEMARLQCDFTFLRRSFLRDVPLDAFGPAIGRIRHAIDAASHRSHEEMTASQRELAGMVAAAR